MFKIIKKDKKTKARLGVLTTLHGKIQTPSYVIVATHGRVKCVDSKDLKKTKTQVVIANTYHLWEKAFKNRGNNLAHKTLGIKMPIMTDSGGFQVFSLGFGFENKVGKILKDDTKKKDIPQRNRKNLKITNQGVWFYLDGRRRFLGPKLSIKLQEKIGADIIFTFDECTSPLDGFEYNKKALERTHKWAKTCLAVHKNKGQILMGIVQGGKFKSLRQKSARFIGSLPFDGFGIGGSFGKNEMVKTLKWVIPYLPEEKPRHLLGIGKINDIFNAIENGVDLFDCVIPTREARHGRLWTNHGAIDIRKKKFAKDKKIIDAGCKCPTCIKKINRSKLHLLFKDKDAGIEKAKSCATLHNVWFFNDLVERIRDSIAKNKYPEFKRKFFNGLK